MRNSNNVAASMLNIPLLNFYSDAKVKNSCVSYLNCSPLQLHLTEILTQWFRISMALYTLASARRQRIFSVCLFSAWKLRCKTEGENVFEGLLQTLLHKLLIVVIRGKEIEFATFLHSPAKQKNYAVQNSMRRKKSSLVTVIMLQFTRRFTSVCDSLLAHSVTSATQIRPKTFPNFHMQVPSTAQSSYCLRFILCTELK